MVLGQARSRLCGLLLITANVIIPLSIIVFATGFFPYKPFLPGLAEYESIEYGSPPDAPFDKIVFMVVDALRRLVQSLARQHDKMSLTCDFISDFVYAENSGFKFTQRYVFLSSVFLLDFTYADSLIRGGNAIPFTAHARSPTVTMPRIKAITTGSIPSFVDLILNFDEADTSSTLAAQDTWLAQLKAKGQGKLLMYGDDTWLKLFPDTFDRQDGTSSFFVSVCFISTPSHFALLPN